MVGLLPESEMRARLLKDEEAYVKWERSQHERRKRMEEQRSKEEGRRREIEMRKKKQMEEEKKRAEEIVARTDQQVAVVMRQKRNASVDRTKRWSWGVGDSPTTGNPQPENRFSRSPLVLSTTHMAFASGLRSYDTSPSNKQQCAPQPQLTEASPVSPRLLAPTKASRARSRTNEHDDSLDSKERPTSAKSDTSASSTKSHETKKKTTRTPSPAMRNKVQSVQNKSPVTSSRSRGVSPKPSRTTRSSSPALERTTNERKKTPLREKPHVGKSTPPTIKQSLRPDVLGRKLKTSPVVKSPKGIPPDGIVKKQRNKKVDSPIGRGVGKKAANGGVGSLNNGENEVLFVDDNVEQPIDGVVGVKVDEDVVGAEGVKDGQQHGGVKDDQQHGGVKDDQQHGGVKDDQQHGGVKDDQQHGGVKDDQQHGGVKDDQQHGARGRKAR
uniref:ensconsin-like n=1 Tax=Ciona intestinalis TaxID=7719 RepID=UPI000EF53CC9|nr:ensconsin-like [Ciona intestinalis]|eukprot:XP_026693892.1 ensconsin-like [Ciona intestinalis]